MNVYMKYLFLAQKAKKFKSFKVSYSRRNNCSYIITKIHWYSYIVLYKDNHKLYILILIRCVSFTLQFTVKIKNRNCSFSLLCRLVVIFWFIRYQLREYYSYKQL